MRTLRFSEVLNRPSGRLGVVGLVVAALVVLWVQFATAQTQSRSLEEAIRAQVALVESRPEDAATIKDLGNLFALAGLDDDAELAYREAIRIEPNDAGAPFNLALLLLEGEPRAALKLLQLAIELDPELAWAHYTLGTVHQRAGRRSMAIAAFSRAFHIDPELALPDRNPHVITNPDATAALLRAAPRREVNQSTPRDYSEPRRIAALLVTQEGAPTSGTTTATDDLATSPLAPGARVSRSRTPSPSGNDTTPATPDERGSAMASGAPASTPRAPLPSRNDTTRATPDEPASSATAPGAPASTSRPPLPSGNEARPAPPPDPFSVNNASAAPTLRQPSAAADVRGAPDAPAIPPAFGASSRRIIRPEDLGSARSSNQATPLTPPSRNQARPRGGNRTVPRDTRFRPGRRSSARLEINLQPSPPDIALAAGG